MGLQVGETHSPAVLQKIVQAAVRNRSYREADQELSESAELRIGAKAVERVVRRIGGERVAEREAATEAFEGLPLGEQVEGCPQPKAPGVAVVQFDCGRLLVRERARRSTSSDVARGRGGEEPARAMEDQVHQEERVREAAMAAAARCSARYRRLGLPIMSSYAESTVKQINHRVKGTEKFWSEAGAEAILQLRADYLSETQPLTRFWQQRQQTATGQRPYRCAA